MSSPTSPCPLPEDGPFHFDYELEVDDEISFKPRNMAAPSRRSLVGLVDENDSVDENTPPPSPAASSSSSSLTFTSPFKNVTSLVSAATVSSATSPGPQSRRLSQSKIPRTPRSANKPLGSCIQPIGSTNTPKSFIPPTSIEKPTSTNSSSNSSSFEENVLSPCSAALSLIRDIDKTVTATTTTTATVTIVVVTNNLSDDIRGVSCDDILDAIDENVQDSDDVIPPTPQKVSSEEVTSSSSSCTMTSSTTPHTLTLIVEEERKEEEGQGGQGDVVVNESPVKLPLLLCAPSTSSSSSSSSSFSSSSCTSTSTSSLDDNWADVPSPLAINENDNDNVCGNSDSGSSSSKSTQSLQFTFEVDSVSHSEHAINPAINSAVELTLTLKPLIPSASEDPTNQIAEAIQTVEVIPTHSSPSPPSSPFSSSSSSSSSSPSSSSSLPSGLSLCYDNTAMHEPKYSQAEFDAAVAKATASLPQQQMQQQSAQSLLTTNELQRQLDAKEHAFSSLLKKVGERECEWEVREKEREKERDMEREEGRLLKSQAKAITHRLKILEEEKTALEEAHKAAIASLTSQHIQETESLTHTIASYKAKLTDASSCITSLEGKLSLVPGELRAAESKGKQYVYDKVKGQFETGNKEFLKVRSQLKTMQDELDALKVMHTSTLSNLSSSTSSLTESQQRECEQKSLAAKLAVECDEIKEQLKATLAKVDCLMTKAREGELTVLDKEKELDVARAELVSARHEFADLQAKHAVLSSSHESLTSSLSSMTVLHKECEEERDSQMLCTAKLGVQLTKAQDDLAEANARCENLRAMNEELLAMLEGGAASS